MKKIRITLNFLILISFIIIGINVFENAESKDLDYSNSIITLPFLFLFLYGRTHLDEVYFFLNKFDNYQ